MLDHRRLDPSASARSSDGLDSIRFRVPIPLSVHRHSVLIVGRIYYVARPLAMAVVMRQTSIRASVDDEFAARDFAAALDFDQEIRI